MTNLVPIYSNPLNPPPDMLFMAGLFHLLTSSAQTLKLFSVVGPNVLLIATSAASRPRAISTRPIRGTLNRASKVYQLLPRYASNHEAKSPGPYGGGTPISLKYPVQ